MNRDWQHILHKHFTREKLRTKHNLVTPLQPHYPSPIMQPSKKSASMLAPSQMSYSSLTKCFI